MDDLSRGLDNLESILDRSKKPDKLNLSVLRLITANFSKDRKIGEGGCGNVYKGILPGRGKTVAVKKLFNSLQMADDRMFHQEVATLMSIEHQNIVQFIGYCSHTDQQAMQLTRKYIVADDERERLLCFEYISNGSLEDHITDELRGLEWEKRFEIIKGICKGLSYLHKEKGIIHMDLKPANILLSDAFVPKITDFGISRLGETTKTISKIRVFSPIYCCPEYRLDGHRSFSSDIYSLGVTIIEIVTGTREDNPNITNVCRRWRHRWNKCADHTTLSGWQQQVIGCLELARRCKNWNPRERPDILDIIHELNETKSSHAIKSIFEQQKDSFLHDMLGINPLEFHFSPKRNEQITQSIQLTNDTKDYIAFMIPVEEKIMYFGVSETIRFPICVHPNKDIVPPGSSCSVTITLEALKEPLQERCVANLCVQSTRLDKGLTTDDITADIFKEEPNKVVDAVNLTVKVSAPKRLLVVEPLELCCWPIMQNKMLAFSVQLTNRTDDYVAFAIILPLHMLLLQQDKVLHYDKACSGIVPPCSTRSVITKVWVEQVQKVPCNWIWMERMSAEEVEEDKWVGEDMWMEEALAAMRRSNMCLVRSVVVEKKLMDCNVSVEFFNEQTGVHEIELNIVFPEPHRAPTSVHCAKKDWEDDKLEILRDQEAGICLFSVETELLHIYYPASQGLHFLRNQKGGEYISLINKTEREVIYVIGCVKKGKYIGVAGGVVRPETTLVTSVSDCMERPHLVRVLMISGSRRYQKSGHLYVYGRDEIFCYQSKREEVMNWVRAEGGKAHEALLTCGLPLSHQKPKVTTIQVRIDNLPYCMDVHPTEPWVVTGHGRSRVVCIWKWDPKAKMSEMMMPTADTYTGEEHRIEIVKFIARKKWVASGDDKGYVCIFTYDDHRVTKFKTIQTKSGPVRAFEVHPSLPYLFSFSASNSIQQWDWDQEWMCTGHFTPPAPVLLYTEGGMTFNPKDDNTLACLGDDGEIRMFSIDSQKGTTCWHGSPATGIAYCNTGSDLQYLVATVSPTGVIEIFDLRSRIRVHTLENMELMGNEDAWWFIACHPTRPLLATANSNGHGVFLWNYTTYILQQVFKVPMNAECMGVGFIDVEGFQRLVVGAKYGAIYMVEV